MHDYAVICQPIGHLIQSNALKCSSWKLLAVFIDANKSPVKHKPHWPLVPHCLSPNEYFDRSQKIMLIIYTKTLKRLNVWHPLTSKQCIISH